MLKYQFWLMADSVLEDGEKRLEVRFFAKAQ